MRAWREGLEDVAYMDLLKRSGNAAAKSLLEAREAVVKANDQKVVDSWRLSAGRTCETGGTSRTNDCLNLVDGSLRPTH